MRNVPLRKLFLVSVFIVILVTISSLVLNFVLSTKNTEDSDRLAKKEFTLLTNLEEIKFDTATMSSYFKRAALMKSQNDLQTAKYYFEKANSEIVSSLQAKELSPHIRKELIIIKKQLTNTFGAGKKDGIRIHK